MMYGESSDQPPIREDVFSELLRYVRFSSKDEGLLRALRPRAAPHFDRIASEFYERIREHEGAHDVFTGEEQIARLQRSLVRWLERLCSGPHDANYFAETAKIGRVHVVVGLPQRYMFGAMALIRTALARVVDDTMGEDAAACREALHRTLDLDLAVMLESYHEHLLARLRQKDRFERAELDQALRRTEHRYRKAVELARVVIVGVDCQGKIRLFNNEAERVTGWGREETLDKPFVEMLIAPPLREEQGALLQTLLEGQTNAHVIQDLESVVSTRANKMRDMLWQLAYAPSDDDDVVLFAVGRDTTNEHALAMRVRQSEKLAAVGTLAAGLAHEIRNPLNGAQLHATFLERGLRKKGAAPEQLEAIRIVTEEIKRLGDLVSEFLDFARPKPLDLRPTSLRGICERAFQLLSSTATQQNVVLDLELPVHDIVLAIDSGKIEQVLLNLLQNAIESIANAKSGKGGTVKLRVRRKPRHALVEVQDDGPGLSSPDAPIFDPFFSTKPQGTGLGLSIVHRVVSDHGGTIDVESRPGKTTFRVIIPIRFENANQKDEP
ncbi:MAG TPA: protoglobin domain-containing protein [Polyangium sp.]|nr:protoglobin domain-containing protein [Polyangium sp.]